MKIMMWRSLDLICEDLEENARVAEQVRFHRFRSHYLLTRLRLYPYVPLFHKARADGLMIDAYDRAQRSSSRRVGYSPEYPWRAKEAAVDLVFDLVAVHHERVRPQKQPTLLFEAVRIARAWSEARPPNEEEFEALAKSLKQAMRTAGPPGVAER